jgi:hypothetical protein
VIHPLHLVAEAHGALGVEERPSGVPGGQAGLGAQA